MPGFQVKTPMSRCKRYAENAAATRAAYRADGMPETVLALWEQFFALKDAEIAVLEVECRLDGKPVNMWTVWRMYLKYQNARE